MIPELKLSDNLASVLKEKLSLNIKEPEQEKSKE